MSHLSRSGTELLAPAGDWEALRAAVACGADAVYFGLSNFNARHRATNFDRGELPAILAYLQERGARGYVTLNTLVFSEELSEIAEFVADVARAGADAVIVQDLGLARLIRRLSPSLPIHASTQMTLTEPRGINLARSLGIERAIVARELSIADIERIASQTDMPLEVFVHGALCVAYSGQCLTSEALGGRSANRGQCAQACRLPYELVVDGQTRDLGDVAYLLSPRDLAAYDLVGDLVRSSVVSLKIEGRLKSAHYVAATTTAYRAALDSAVADQPFELSRQARLDMEQSFSRGFSHGFLAGPNHQTLVQGRFPKHRGVRLGKVVELSPRGIVVELDSDHSVDAILAGDGVVFDQGHPEQDEKGGRVYSVGIVDDSVGKAATVSLRFADGAVNARAISIGAIVWKTDDPRVRKRLERAMHSTEPRRTTPLDFRLTGRVGGELTIAATTMGVTCSVAWSGPLAVAAKHPFTMELLTEQLGRLGGSRHSLGNIETDLDAGLMIPKSVLNDLRRQLVERLEERTSPARGHAIACGDVMGDLRSRIARRPSQTTNNHRESPDLHVLARSMDQLEAALVWRSPVTGAAVSTVHCDFEDIRRYVAAVERANAAGMPIGLASLRVMKPGEEGPLHKIASARPDMVLARNLGTIDFFREQAPDLPLVGDFSLNVTNELTADYMCELGLSRLTPGYDMTWEQLRSMLRWIEPSLFEVVIHQHMPMFHMEHCVFAATLSNGKDWRDCGRPCDDHRVELRDRVGAAFPLLADTGCRNTVFNSVPQSAAEFVPRMLDAGLRHFRVELLRERGDEVAPLLDRYARVLARVDDGRSAWRGLQVLNQLGVTRGTFRASS